MTVPAGVKPGQAFTFTDPNSGQEMKATAPKASTQVEVKLPRERPAQPYPAATIDVGVPAGMGEGQTFKFTHPDTQKEISVVVPPGGVKTVTVTC